MFSEQFKVLSVIKQLTVFSMYLRNVENIMLLVLPQLGVPVPFSFINITRAIFNVHQGEFHQHIPAFLLQQV